MLFGLYPAFHYWDQCIWMDHGQDLAPPLLTTTLLMGLLHIVSWSGFWVSRDLSNLFPAKSIMNWSNFGGEATGVDVP